ncbi:hypothetical protein BB561_005888 [Smittium simulii]|uniref:Transcription elongation factor n=1 Tax=Smittium simulii TaxID=133385 RepID=A0A2T9Y7V1_9FUNG|nr:hypothetical protein BB561_005888 [Smittium simulii]
MDSANELKKSLLSAVESANSTTVCDVLNQLYKITATEDLLKKTGIGMVVGKLRNDKSAEISKLAKAVVHKWKKNVTEAAATAKKKAAEKDLASKSPIIISPKHSPKTTLPIQNPISVKPVQSPPATDSSSKPVQARNFASDKVSFPSTSSKARDKSIELLYNSLCIDSDKDSSIISDKAVEIENAEFDKHKDVNQAYKSEMRSFFLNLKDPKNPNLRLSVIENKILVKDFVNMTPEDMASEERKRLDMQIYKDNLFKSQGAGPQEAETDMFRCGRCGKRKCRYYQLQTRSADEPMTTFVTCTNCNHRWKFC